MHTNIDILLANYGLFRLQNFSYTIGDCLFIRIYIHITWIETRDNRILSNLFSKTIYGSNLSYHNEINAFSLMEMHNVNDPKVYLQKMSRSTSIQIAPHERGLWGDIFLYTLDV